MVREAGYLMLPEIVAWWGPSDAIVVSGSTLTDCFHDYEMWAGPIPHPEIPS